MGRQIAEGGTDGFFGAGAVLDRRAAFALEARAVVGRGADGRALRVLAGRPRRTPRDFLLRTEDPRLVALLPELFDAGRSVNRNAEAADIRELHGQISASLGCPAWVASFLSVWTDGGERPLRSAAAGHPRSAVSSSSRGPTAL